MENNKTEQLLAYLSKGHSNASVTVLMKLAYLVDLIAIKRTGKQISSFEYRRYHFGPFDQGIYNFLNSLVEKQVLKPSVEYTKSGGEAVVYHFNDEKRDFFSKILTADEIGIVDELLDSVGGYGAKILTQIAYKTQPMKNIGATLGGNENMNAKLNLKA